ncbi:MAG: hypothetical protein HC880_11265, partial [Bacteroidia bacterium]|nr:hypothetical protein [Bacteroidia bacterium]
MTVISIDEVTIQAEGDTLFCEDQSVELMLRADGSDTLSYQWQKNGSDIMGATQKEYEVREAGLYSVLVTIDSCSRSSNRITVTQTPRPSVRAGLNNRLLLCNVDENISLLDFSPVGGVWSSTSAGADGCCSGFIQPPNG